MGAGPASCRLFHGQSCLVSSMLGVVATAVSAFRWVWIVAVGIPFADGPVELLDCVLNAANLADAVDSLKERAARHSLAVAAAVGTAKRYLSGRATAIGLHDLIG